MKTHNPQPLYIFNRENPQNSEPQNGPRRGLDLIALSKRNLNLILTPYTPLIHTSFTTNVLKMEYLSKITIFVLKMMVKSGLEKKYSEIPPCTKLFF
jgi:hypothetical protein